MSTSARARLALLIEAQGAQRARGEVDGVTAATRRLGHGTEAAAVKTSIANRVASTFTSTLRGMGRALKYGALAGTGLALILGKKAVSATLDLGRATLSLQRVTGLSTRSASEWVGIGKIWGVEGDRVTNIFARLGKQMLAAKQGNKSAILTFKGLGVSMDTIRRGKVDELIGRVADRMKSMSSITDRAGLATQLFGRGMGTKMLPMLVRGQAGIDELKKKLLEAGATFRNTKDIRKNIEAHHQFEISMLGLQVTLGKVLIPALTWGMKKIGIFLAYVRREWPKLKAFFAPVVDWVAGKLRWLSDKFAKLPPGLKKAAIGIAAAFAIAFGGPVTTVLAIAAIAALVIKNWKPISKFFTDLWSKVSAAFTKGVAWVKNQLGISTADLHRFWQAIKTIGGAAIKAAIAGFVFTFKLLWPVVKRTIGGVITTIRGAVRIIGGVIQVIGAVVTGHWGRAWHGLKAIVSGTFTSIFGFFKTVTAPFRTAFGAIFGGIGGIVSKVFGGVISFIKGAIGTVIDVINDAIRGYNAVGGWATGNIAEIPNPWTHGDKADPSIVSSGGHQTITPASPLGALPPKPRVKPVKRAPRARTSAMRLHPDDIKAIASAFRENPARAIIDGKDAYDSHRRYAARAAAMHA